MASSTLYELWSDLAPAGASDGFPVSTNLRSTCLRSCPDHGPEVGPPVRLIYGDVAGWRNGGARTREQLRREAALFEEVRAASPRSLMAVRFFFGIL